MSNSPPPVPPQRGAKPPQRLVSIALPHQSIGAHASKTLVIAVGQPFDLERLVMVDRLASKLGVLQLAVGAHYLYEAINEGNPLPCSMFSQINLSLAPPAGPQNPIVITLYNLSDAPVVMLGSLIGLVADDRPCSVESKNAPHNSPGAQGVQSIDFQDFLCRHGMPPHDSSGGC